MSPRNLARHRAARRPTTPVTLLARSATPAARRGLAMVATSGLVMTAAATSVAAAQPEPAALPRVDVSAVAGAAVVALRTTASVSVPADLPWDAPAVSAEATPPPEPVVERSVPAASRSGERASLATVTTPDTAVAVDAAAPTPPASSSSVVDLARQFLGTPYVWGGTTPAGFDCSGFVQYVFAQLGIALPRTSAEQALVGTRIPAAEARPGDIVTWPGHVGIYTGDGNNIAARRPGTPLMEGPIHSSSPTFIRVG